MHRMQAAKQLRLRALILLADLTHFAVTERLSILGVGPLVASFFATMDGAAAAAAASIASGDHPTVVCAACSQSSGPFSKRQLKKAQAGEPARKCIYGTQI